MKVTGSLAAGARMPGDKRRTHVSVQRAEDPEKCPVGSFAEERTSMPVLPRLVPSMPTTQAGIPHNESIQPLMRCSRMRDQMKPPVRLANLPPEYKKAAPGNITQRDAVTRRQRPQKEGARMPGYGKCNPRAKARNRAVALHALLNCGECGEMIPPIYRGSPR